MSELVDRGQYWEVTVESARGTAAFRCASRADCEDWRAQRGTVDHGAVRVGRCTRALQHEATVIMLRGYHSHAPDSPTILCEHAGPRPFPCSCEPRPE